MKLPKSFLEGVQPKPKLIAIAEVTKSCQTFAKPMLAAGNLFRKILPNVEFNVVLMGSGSREEIKRILIDYQQCVV